jgi:hypothetical protein
MYSELQVKCSVMFSWALAYKYILVFVVQALGQRISERATSKILIRMMTNSWQNQDCGIKNCISIKMKLSVIVTSLTTLDQF